MKKLYEIFLKNKNSHRIFAESLESAEKKANKLYKTWTDIYERSTNGTNRKGISK